MLKRPRPFLLIGLVIFVVACNQARPTPTSLPTNTSLPATPTPSAVPTTAALPSATALPSPSLQPTTSPASVLSTVASSTPTVAPPEPTRTSASPTPESRFPPAIDLVPVLSGFQSPLFLTYAAETPPWASRLFVVEQAGRIWLVENGQLQALPFLDITDRVGSSASEQGLLSVAFPPDFGVSEAFYVNYTDQSGDTVVARYRLLQTDPPQGDPASEQKLLEIAQPARNHNGGQLRFGPDGYLYVGMGDGGRAGDPWGNAQNPQVLLGKLLRIDVSGADGYRIPQDNPFLDRSDVSSEIWALGLRNPWRFSFDRATGDLYIADVGQNVYEEVNFRPAHSGGGENYGWDVMEGAHCFEPQQGCEQAGLILPVAEYDHGFGCSVTGGHVYRGTGYPMLTGVYFFGDYCSGRIWGLRQLSSGEWSLALLLDSDVSISSFGEDVAGEIYVVGYGDGTIYQLVALP